MNDLKNNINEKVSNYLGNLLSDTLVIVSRNIPLIY